jgi:type IV pilus assembly protein PilA
MICALCAAENPINGRFCSRCGAMLQGQRGIAPPGLGFDPSPGPYLGPKETSGKAVASLICGILFFLFPVAIVAIILGHLSLADIRRSAGRLTGSGMATVGLVLGYLGLSVIPIMIVAAIVIPNLLRARMAANEASAIGSIRIIETAAITYQANYANGYPPSLKAMDGSGSASPSCDHAQLIEPTLASGRNTGYVFTYIALPAMADSRAPDSPQAAANGCTVRGGTTFTLNADPVERGNTGQRSFFADQFGVIRFDENSAATAGSEPIR